MLYVVLAGCVAVGAWMKHTVIRTLGRTVDTGYWAWLGALIAITVIDFLVNL